MSHQKRPPSYNTIPELPPRRPAEHATPAKTNSAKDQRGFPAVHPPAPPLPELREVPEPSHESINMLAELPRRELHGGADTLQAHHAVFPAPVQEYASYETADPRHTGAFHPAGPPNMFQQGMNVESKRASHQFPVPRQQDLPRRPVPSPRDQRASWSQFRGPPDGLPGSRGRNEKTKSLDVGPLYEWIGQQSPSPSGSVSTSFVSTNSGPKVFQYRELEEGQFRIIRLFPATMSTIKCELLHASLEDSPEYTAISYTWGDADDTIKIQVAGCNFEITTSLHGALKRLRQPSRSVLLWADALCIDQNNKQEQSQQVQHMAHIYSRAESVAIWLGPESDDSESAIHLIQSIASSTEENDGNKMRQYIESKAWRLHLSAVVRLFERDYWSRLWIVQEVLNARSKTVYCGDSALPWATYDTASVQFGIHRDVIKREYPSGLNVNSGVSVSRNRLSYADVLCSQGPASLVVTSPSRDLSAGSLLEALRLCRMKLASEPRDKVYGVLGILHEDVRYDFPPNYSASLKEVYTDVVDFLLHTTERLDVMCEAIYFPLHKSSANLPSWVPDWSHIPQTGSLGLARRFSAAADTKAKFKLSNRRNKLEIWALELDQVSIRGVAVGTFCGLDDYLMAFLHWRAKLVARVGGRNSAYLNAFCRTLRLDKSSEWGDPDVWRTVCHHVFASLIRERLPLIKLDEELEEYANLSGLLEPEDRRRVLYDNCASSMMGRCFFVTQKGFVGMGTGFMDPGDVVCVAPGCSTPILLRQEGSNGEYRFVGDAYVEGFMYGRAVEPWNDRKQELKKFALH
jgi:hypothetical protein